MANKRAPDRALEAGSRAHYTDAAYYEHNYSDRKDDIAYYVQLALKHRGPLLELGVGNGRIALPVARASKAEGKHVWGVDLSKAMLDDLRTRLNSEPAGVRERVHIRRGDIRSVRLGQKFPLVIAPFNTVLHLYERRDVERFLQTVHVHLAPNGVFVADLSVPMPEDMLSNPEKLERTPPFVHPTVGKVRYGERFDYDTIRQILFVSMEFEPLAKGRVPFTTPLCHRQFFPREWESLLHYNGFKAIATFGDFGGGPLQNASETMIWHAKQQRLAKGTAR